MLTLRQIQSEWNALVPQARARGIRRVSVWQLPPETRSYGMQRLTWLRDQLGSSTAITTPTVPTDFDGMTFGVELECFMPRGMNHHELAAHIARANVPCAAEGYNHALRSHWKVTTDASLGDYALGTEIVSPVLSGEEGFRQLRAVCKVLTDLRCKVNRRCGFHVHVGARGDNVHFFKNIVRMYARYQSDIDEFMAPSRRGGANQFCLPVIVGSTMNEARTVADVMRSSGQIASVHYARGSERYKKLNLQSYLQHGTVEFRHHQGTVECAKVENWVRLCLRMVKTARAWGENYPTTFPPLLEQVGASESEVAFFNQRRAHFGNGNSDESETGPEAMTPQQARDFSMGRRLSSAARI